MLALCKATPASGAGMGEYRTAPFALRGHLHRFCRGFAGFPHLHQTRLECRSFDKPSGSPGIWRCVGDMVPGAFDLAREGNSHRCESIALSHDLAQLQRHQPLTRTTGDRLEDRISRRQF
jgi:hypothetical protein